MDPTTGKPNQPIYFITAIVCGWKHLLANEACARLALESLAWFRDRGRMDLYGFVLLPSHLHCLCRPKGAALEEILHKYAEFTAQRMVSILRYRGRRLLMHYFHDRSGGERPGDPIWKEIRSEEVRSAEAAWKKLEWMHAKPLRTEWRLAATPGEYLYSSACFYELGTQPILSVEDLRLAFIHEARPGGPVPSRR